MRSFHNRDRLDTAFEGTQLVTDAGLLLLPATIAHHPGLTALVEWHLDLDAALCETSAPALAPGLTWSVPAVG